MKLFAYSSSGLLAGQIVAQLSAPQCLTRLPRHPAFQFGLGRPAQHQWQRRTLAQAPSYAKNPLSDQVRLLMRRVPYPVAIITATDPHNHKDGQIEHSYRGMTVSSFSTVTLYPEPVVSFNVKRPSETLNSLLSSGRFLVHLLAPAKPTADLARDFSRGNHNLSIVGGEGDFEFAAHGPHSENENERPLPLLRRREVDARDVVDFPVVFECKLLPQQMEVFDHTVVLGRVVDTILQRPLNAEVKGQQAGPDELCLTYANTKFWEMGHEIKG